MALAHLMYVAGQVTMSSWKGEGQERPVVVQKVNPAERTAMVLFTDTNSTELVSLLELDPHGSTDPELFGTPDEYGVGQGDIVFIHPEGQTNGTRSTICTPPRRIGTLGNGSTCIRRACLKPRLAEGNVHHWLKPRYATKDNAASPDERQ